jgi:hypothetical protein
MWRLWSRLFELLGGIPIAMRPPKRLRVGDPAAPDAMGGWGWREYLDAERLFDVWGPVPDSPWVPFHCVPLFAALDSLTPSEIGPAPPPEERTGEADPRSLPSALRDALRGGLTAPAWLTGDTWTILDLPGPAAVEVAAWLITRAGCQPVCTFDHWPHERGVLRAELILAELLRWATLVAEARSLRNAGSPPLWICDSERLGTRAGVPREFDNRYYLDDSILPGPGILRRAGIRKVIYLTLTGEQTPQLDLEAYFADLLAAGFPILHAELMNPLREPTPFQLPTSPRRLKESDYHRSSAGGFGTEIPQPSSGGGG